MSRIPLWVVVADGGSARYFQRSAPGAALHEVAELAASVREAAPARDRPPRVHEKFGPTRHGISIGDTPHDKAEHAFLGEVAARVDRIASAPNSCRIVLVAPPKALGLLRERLSDATRPALVSEIAKDLVREPLKDIDERLRQQGL